MISSVGNELLQNTELPKDVIVYIIQEMLMITKEEVMRRHAEMVMEFSAHTWTLTLHRGTAYPSNYRYLMNWEKEQERRREKAKECRWDVIFAFVVTGAVILGSITSGILHATGVI